MESIQEESKVAATFNAIQADYDKLVKDTDELLTALTELAKYYYGPADAKISENYKKINTLLGSFESAELSYLKGMKSSYDFCQTVDAQIQTKLALYTQGIDA
jgi:hypothetical protein